eukprot:9322202-Karenia_brevis.AAC.1
MEAMLEARPSLRHPPKKEDDTMSVSSMHSNTKSNGHAKERDQEDVKKQLLEHTDEELQQRLTSVDRQTASLEDLGDR